MSLKEWADNGWLRGHATNPGEIVGLLAIVERDLADAESDISADWRFGIAYNAAQKLCTLLLHASGYRATAALQHYRTIAAVPLIMGDAYSGYAQYLESCRKKRNTVEYDMAGAATEQDAQELVDFVREFRDHVLAWLRRDHPELSAPPEGGR